MTSHLDESDFEVALCYPDTGEPYHTVNSKCTYHEAIAIMKELLKKYDGDELGLLCLSTGRHMSWVIR